MWLSIGPETEHPGSLRLDIRPVADVVGDVRDLARFTDGTFEGVECFHVLEHLLPEEARWALEEFWRVLRPGGVCEVSTPDMLLCCQTLLRGDEAILWNIFSPSWEKAQQHRWGYTPASLCRLVAGVFGNAREIARGIDSHEVRVRAIKEVGDGGG